MRNKKYRPIKLWIILFALVLISSPIGLFVLEGWKKYLMLIASIGIFLTLILALTYWFEVKEDKILIRHGLSSFNKQYRSNFKTKIILINDINGLDLREGGKAITINLKNGDSIYFPIGGYLNHGEIIQLVYDVKKQIYPTNCD